MELHASGDEATGAADVRASVRRTTAQKTARLMLAWADGPVPDDADILSEGLVDFAHDRVWVRQRNATARMTADGMTADSKVVRLFWRLHGRRWSERYLEGGAIFKRSRKDGTWSESRWGGASLNAPKQLEHPLWLLGSLARLRSDAEPLRERELVRGVETTRYSISLSEDEMSADHWRELAQPNAPGPRAYRWWRYWRPTRRSTIPAFVWLDRAGRIRRMGYESLYRVAQDPPDGVRGWTITDFWDFGLNIDLQRPKSGSTPSAHPIVPP